MITTSGQIAAMKSVILPIITDLPEDMIEATYMGQQGRWWVIDFDYMNGLDRLDRWIKANVSGRWKNGEEDQRLFRDETDALMCWMAFR